MTDAKTKTAPAASPAAPDLTDPTVPHFRVKTPRDVAINKDKASDAEGLEESVPDHSERVVVSHRHLASEQFKDHQGNVWELTKRAPGATTVLSRAAIIKDGGDPDLLGIGDNTDKFEVEGVVSNAVISPNGIMDTETGAIREKTPEEIATGVVAGAETGEGVRKTSRTTKARRVGNGKGAGVKRKK